MKKYLIIGVFLSIVSCDEKKDVIPKTNSLLTKNMTDVIVAWENSNALGKNNDILVSPKYKDYEKPSSSVDHFSNSIPSEKLLSKLEWAYGSEHLFSDKKVILVRYFLMGESIRLFGEKLLTLEDDGKYYIIPSQYWEISILKRATASAPVPGSAPNN